MDDRPRRPGRRVVWLAALATVAAMVAAVPSGACQLPSAPPAAEPADAQAPEPVGWETFRQLDRLPFLASSSVARSFSSFDPRGGNGDGFSGDYSCLCQATSGCVLAEHVGPGELTSIWFTRGDGDVTATGRILIELDGRAVVDAPLQELVDGERGPPFVYPLVANADQSSGGVYVQVPMPFRRSMRVVTEHNPRFYRIQYRALVSAAGVETFDPEDPALDVVQRLRDAGSADPKPSRGDRRDASASFTLPPGESRVLGRVEGPGAVTALRLRLPQVRPVPSEDGASERLLRDLRLRIAFDGRQTVDAPVGEFFGAGLGEARVAALLFAVDPAGWYEAWWPMPFARTATVELDNGSDVAVDAGRLELTWEPDERWEQDLGTGGRAGYFHATARRGATEPRRDWPLVEAAGQGRIVGVSQTMAGTRPGRVYLEGDERVYADGARSPQVHGTGTEDFYLGGWYFNRGPFTTPFGGHTAHLVGQAGCAHQCDATYRVLAADAIPFRAGVRAGIEHGPANDVPARYSSTTFWYGRDEPSAVVTDRLEIGDPSSERAHGYQAPDAPRPRHLASAFEGPLAGETVEGRVQASTGTVRFHLRIDPDNAGVLLRRTFDQWDARQAAIVAVDGDPVRLWFQPADNPVQRWADDAVLLPAASTRGRDELSLTLVPLDGAPPWTASRYEALSLRRG